MSDTATRRPTAPSPLTALFPGSDAAATRARETDWAATPLGDPSGWSEELCAAIRTVMPSRIPMLLWWGPDLVQIYNEAYRDFLGEKHPRAMGEVARECWAEVWEELGPMTSEVWEHGEATYNRNLLLFLDRHGYTEETYWTFSYSPVHAADGTVLGIFVATTDVTKAVVEARRLETVRELALVSAADMLSLEQVCQRAMTIMSGNRRALPFAAIYLREPGGDLAFASGYGVRCSGGALPTHLAAEADHPLAAVLSSGTQQLVGYGPDSDLTAEPSPLGPAVPTSAMVLPLSTYAFEPDGVLVLGINPYRKVDDSYRSFIDLIARQMSTLLADVRKTRDERDRALLLTELDAAKTKFFQNVSHEFRTPLTVAMAATRELRSERLTDSQSAHLDAAEHAVVRLNRLVDALLEFARAEAGTLIPVVEPLDLAAVTGDLVSMFRSAVEQAGLTLELTVGEDVGTAWTDREAWAKIVVNLVSNAFKFTPEGAITVELTRDGDDVCLVVRDTGSGIPVEDRQRIFERFQQVRQPDLRGVQGVGIGLALVADLVRAQGGEVAVESELGRGSAFTVRLPVAEPAVVDANVRRDVQGGTTDLAAVASPLLDVSPTRPSQALPVHETTNARLLLVEDNTDLRGYLSRLLASDRWEVTAVGDVVSALEVAQVPDLILSDIMLPGLSGLDLVRLVRADERLADVPVVLLSARAGSEAAAEGLAAGADDYVVKPFEPIELLSRLRVHGDLALRRGRTLERAQQTAEHLELALHTNRSIGIAMGILMARHRVTSEEAFGMLRRRSTTTNTKLRLVAEEVLAQGDLV
ncbi:ATP-binding protein [Pedococcus sp. 5OH_020]|uniref:ATP-binding protein n=1 Tax=Pedococcus sp. 5OH_020 TaxID=2989814 RepID=UPI0022E99BBF|nr:ATP-binding protein [Pedococcus sp. 5OH_020]